MTNVALRTPTDADEDLLYRLKADLDTWEERTPASPYPLTLAQYRERAGKGELRGDADFVITVDGHDVGMCTIFREDTLSHHAEVGIALLPDSRGQGIGTEAMRQLVEFAFVRRNLRRVYLWVLSSNVAGLASYKKVGFVEEGRHREHCWVRGHYEDEVAMGLLRSEWRPDGGS
ncbi:MAG TPA: GNAT family protein [Jatrophihabitantaceae bacterium]|nr:GNAT family protein [Jatrophihabitantaceae bacterium]